jgi:hypothetical protein
MKLRRGKHDDEQEELPLEDAREKPKKNKIDKDQGSRFAAMWLMIITILLSIGFWFWGGGLLP